MLVALLAGILIGSLAAPVGAVPGLSSRTDPAYSYGTYAASDTVDFIKGPSRQIIVPSGGGALALVDLDGNVVVTPEFAEGTVLSVVAKRINETDSTATGPYFVKH